MSETERAFKLVYECLENARDNAFQALTSEPMKVAQIPFLIGEMCESEKREAANLQMEALIKDVESIPLTIDLSNDTRRVFYETVRDNFNKTLILSGPDMQSNALANLILEHSDFLRAFNLLEDTELELRARRLTTLTSLLRA